MARRTLEQLQGKATLVLEQALRDASGRRFDDVHKQLWHTHEGRRLLSAVRMAVSEPVLVRLAAAAAGTEPSGFADSSGPEPTSALSPGQQKALRDLLAGWTPRLSPEAIDRILEEVSTVYGVEGLSSWLQQNASSDGSLDGNSAKQGGIGAARPHAGLHQLVRGGMLSADEAEAEAAAQQAEGSFGGGGRRASPQVLNLRMQSGRNAIEKAMSLVRSRDKSISFDDCWVQACELLRRARQDGTEIRT